MYRNLFPEKLISQRLDVIVQERQWMIRENITLNRVQECKVDIEKRSCGRTSRGKKKSGCHVRIMERLDELDEKQEVRTTHDKIVPRNITWNYFNRGTVISASRYFYHFICNFPLSTIPFYIAFIWLCLFRKYRNTFHANAFIFSVLILFSYLI